jgi:hypothetical protein
MAHGVSSIEDCRERNEDARLDVVKESKEWRPVVRLIDGWANQKLGSTSGYSSEELDHFSRVQGVRFPPMLREWWRLAGRHPFVEPGLCSDNARFLQPHDKWLFDRRDFLAIAVDDWQTWSCNGIHVDLLSEVNPEVHGINGTIGPKDAPGLNWYKGAFIATGLRVPALIFSTLLYHLFTPSPFVRSEAVYLAVEREGLRGGQPDERLIAKLGLKRFPNETIIGDIYSDGEDIIYWWMMGCACRSSEAAERVLSAVAAYPRRD